MKDLRSVIYLHHNFTSVTTRGQQCIPCLPIIARRGHYHSAHITLNSFVIDSRLTFLRRSITVFPASQDSDDLSGFHHRYNLGRHIEPPYSHLDHQIACITSGSGETALSTQKLGTTFLLNHWTKQCQNKASGLLLYYLEMVPYIFLKKRLLRGNSVKTLFSLKIFN